MHNGKFLVTEEDVIGGLPSGAICDVIIIHQENNEALIYFPVKTRYLHDGEYYDDIGEGSFSFAKKCGDYWSTSYEDYLNVSDDPDWLKETKQEIIVDLSTREYYA